MATTIRVDPDDELPSILDRLSARAVCILVLPPHARALNSVVGAKLLARRAQALGTAVAVVSEDRAVMAHVRAAGIPIAASVAEAARLLPAAPPPPEAGVVNSASDPLPAGENGASGAVAAHEALTMPHTVVQPDEDTAPDAAANGHDAGAAGAAAARPSQTYRLVAPAPAISAPPDSTAASDNTALTGQPEETEQPGVRGHSGGARAARRGNRASSSDPNGSGAAGATFTAGEAAAHTAGTAAAGTTSARATPSGGASTGGARAGVRPPRGAAVRRRGRWFELLGSARLTRVLAPVLLGLVLLALLLWLITSLLNPSATLTVQARAMPVTAENPVVVHTYMTTPPLKRLGVYTRLYAVAPQVAGSVAIPVNGTQIVPGAVAIGQIELRNPSSHPVFVPSGSAFTTYLNAHSFVTTRDITVPAARFTFDGAVYGKAAVAIKAAVGGTGGNVPAKAIQYAPAAINILSVTNASATAGGTNTTQKVPLQSDVDTAARTLFAQLEAEARQKIADLVVAGGVEQHALWEARSPVQPQVNGARTSATLALSLVLHAVYVHKADLQQVARTSIGTPQNLIPGSVTYTAAWRPDNSIVLQAAARTAPPINRDTIRAAIAGRSKEAALSYLDSQSDIIATYHLDLSPSWAGHVPGDSSHIHITVQPAQ